MKQKNDKKPKEWNTLRAAKLGDRFPDLLSYDEGLVWRAIQSLSLIDHHGHPKYEKIDQCWKDIKKIAIEAGAKKVA